MTQENDRRACEPESNRKPKEEKSYRQGSFHQAGCKNTRLRELRRKIWHCLGGRSILTEDKRITRKRVQKCSKTVEEYTDLGHAEPVPE